VQVVVAHVVAVAAEALASVTPSVQWTAAAAAPARPVLAVPVVVATRTSFFTLTMPVATVVAGTGVTSLTSIECVLPPTAAGLTPATWSTSTERTVAVWMGTAGMVMVAAATSSSTCAVRSMTRWS